ncbi:MAG: carboxysome shell carbonic anhydrase [Gammaproteobacteria bacterium]|nr:carboxysome shell carbonic anhydrase [Gammaproteobacteria bacterium]
MNTRNAYKIRARKAAASRASAPTGRHATAPVGLGISPSAAATPDTDTPAALFPHPACSTLPSQSCRHPLTDGNANARLAHCEEFVKGKFDAIEPTLKTIAGLPYTNEFAERAQQVARQALEFDLPEQLLNDAWVVGPDMKALYAHCAFAALKASAAKFVDDLNRQVETVQDTRNFFLDCGFHAVDISPCADGRLKGLTRYILRLPLSSFTRRKAYAGALFDVETDVHHWEETELRRFREGVPTTADAGTRYLKIAVYHTSSSAPSEQGCAAHGSNENKAIQAAMERLTQFREAIENAFCCGASTDILLIGVDTDTDAIKVHVPDGNGDISQHRFIDNAELYKETLALSEDQARIKIYDTIISPNVKSPGWGSGQGEPHEGMRRLIANLLINNMSQIEYVGDLYGGRYPDIGHAERYISVGDGFEEVQMRNVAYYAHLHTLEEGVADMDVGIKIFTGLNAKRGLPIPVAIHYRYDARVPGSRERSIAKAERVRDAINARYDDLVAKGLLHCHLSVQDRPTGSPIETVGEDA